MPDDTTQIERKETGMRILLNALFVVIWHVAETVLGVIILFQLAFAFITKRAPGEHVKRFANRVLSSLYHILRYLTYHELKPPFPFADFPPELEPANQTSKQRTDNGEGQQGPLEQ
jgi:hypothetical protein